MRIEVLLTAVVGLGALSIDMFLPSLPAIAHGFSAPPATAQLTVTLFLATLAACQLVYGPLSDRFGRRWVLIGGLGLYATAGLVCASASTMAMLIAARVLQALRETTIRRDPTALQPAQLLQNIATLLSDKAYLAYALANALMFGGQFAFISGSAFVLITLLGVSPSVFGRSFGAVAVGLMAGNFLSGRCGPRLGLDRTILCGTSLGAVAGLTMAALAWSGVLTLPSVIAPMFCFAVGLGLTLPTGAAGALVPLAWMAGLPAAAPACI